MPKHQPSADVLFRPIRFKTMEGHLSRPSGAGTRRRHERHRNHGHGESSKGIEKRRDVPQGNSRHIGQIERHPRHLDEGLIHRFKEKNDEYIQSWLQQTQTRRYRHPEPDHNSSLPQSRAHWDRDMARLRHQSESPKATRQDEYRFEKRARHKTRDDKYEYKACVGRKRVSD